MRYAVLIFEAPEAYAGLSDEERAMISAEYAVLGRDERVFGAARLQPRDTATTVRVAEGKTLTTDGPFADTKEVFGGYYLLDADDLDLALEFAERIPAARLGGAVEVRPIAG